MLYEIKKYIKNKQKGVAILIVLVAITLLTTIVTEVSSKETIKYKLAIHERDGLAAEALAQSAVNFSELILMVQEPIQSFLSNFAKAGVELPSYVMWNLFSLDSDLLKGLNEGSGLFSASKEKSKEAKSDEEERNKKQVKLFGPYEAPSGGYGGFRGSFHIDSIVDEESKISLREFIKPSILPKQKKQKADQIYFILSKPKYQRLFDGSLGDTQNFSPMMLIGNIYDFFTEGENAVDVTASAENWGRDGRINKKLIYANTPGILPKRAKPDSLAEIRLIPGMTDAIYNLLERYLSIYSEAEGVNILSASDEVLESIFYMCVKNRESALSSPEALDNLMQNWRKSKGEGKIKLSQEGIINFLKENNLDVDNDDCKKMTNDQSKNFTIKAVATVGNVTKTLIVRVRCSGGVSTIYQFMYL